MLIVLEKKTVQTFIISFNSTSYYKLQNTDELRTFISSSQFDVEYQQYHISYDSNNGNHCQHDDYRQERIVYKQGNNINIREPDFNQLHFYR